ncbi:AAA ATPase [Modicella reniformis]|uniref:AAA ATPase n=1 Tax=Modicella reniformis TaxID=1440133 RepID=A0A9P6MBP4_9FUNG|nr:AAA ATPase [Modicella reniformis]
MTNFLRKRALEFSDGEDENPEAWPTSPSKRRSGTASKNQFLRGTLKPIAPPNLSNHLDDDDIKPVLTMTRAKAKVPLETPCPSPTSDSPPVTMTTSLETITPPRTPPTRRSTRQQAVNSENILSVDTTLTAPKKSSGELPTPKTPTPKTPTRPLSSRSLETDPPKTPTRTLPSRSLDTDPPKTPTRTLSSRSLETVPPKTPTRTLSSRSLEADPPKTPTRTLSSRSLDSGTPKKSNQSTGLTPAMNKMMKPSKDVVNANAKGKKPIRETQNENATEDDSTKIQGYATPKRVQKTRSPLGLVEGSTATAPTTSASTGSTSPVSATLGYYQDAKSLFRRTTEPHRLVGRATEREVIQRFCEDHILTPKAGSLYISGQPGTGKSALLKEILRDMAPKMDEAEHEIKTVVVNCMTIKDPRFVYQKLLESLGYTSESKEKDSPLKALESVVLEPRKKTVIYVVVLDEIDQLLTKDQDVLYKMFEWCSIEDSKLTLFGIANALDMTDRFLPRLKARNCEPQLLNFNPYQVAEIRDIIMDRLFSLEDHVHAQGNNRTSNKDENAKTRVAPLMQRPAIELCARKVAAATGDLRKALDICRQAIEMVEAETKKKERQERQLGRMPRNYPLSEIWLTDLENQVAGGADTSIISHRHRSPPATDAPTTTTASEAVKLQDVPKVTVEHMKKALASAFGSPMVQKMKTLNLHQKIVLAVVATKTQSGKAADCEIGKVFDHYTMTCRTSNKIGAVNRGEYQDLINMLEANGLITLNKAKEERLRKIVLVPQESEVVEAIKGQELLDAILFKAGLLVGATV